MKSIGTLLAATLFAALPFTAEAQFFSDNFDSYATGSTIMGQGGWTTWDGTPAWDTTVTSAQANSPANSLLVAGPADIVHTFTGASGGIWYAKAMTYVPSTQTGEMFFILLNGWPVVNGVSWSVQVAFCQTGCTTTGVVAGKVVNLGGSEVGGGGSVDLITNQWVQLRVEVNLGTNQYSVYYNHVLVDTRAWTTTGPLAIAAVDLYSNASNESYMDDIWLDTTVPVELQSLSIE